MADKHHETAIVPATDSDGDVQEKEFQYDGTIPSKYRGTTADQRDMVLLGKKQVLRVCNDETSHLNLASAD